MFKVNLNVLLVACLLTLSTAAQPNIPQPNIISGHYHTLYLDARDFDALKNDNYIFINYVKGNSLTLPDLWVF